MCPKKVFRGTKFQKIIVVFRINILENTYIPRVLSQTKQLKVLEANLPKKGVIRDGI